MLNAANAIQPPPRVYTPLARFPRCGRLDAMSIGAEQLRMFFDAYVVSSLAAVVANKGSATPVAAAAAAAASMALRMHGGAGVRGGVAGTSSPSSAAASMISPEVAAAVAYTNAWRPFIADRNVRRVELYARAFAARVLLEVVPGGHAAPTPVGATVVVPGATSTAALLTQLTQDGIAQRAWNSLTTEVCVVALAMLFSELELAALSIHLDVLAPNFVHMNDQPIAVGSTLTAATATATATATAGAPDAAAASESLRRIDPLVFTAFSIKQLFDSNAMCDLLVPPLQRLYGGHFRREHKRFLSARMFSHDKLALPHARLGERVRELNALRDMCEELGW